MNVSTEETIAHVEMSSSVPEVMSGAQHKYPVFPREAVIHWVLCYSPTTACKYSQGGL